MPMARTRRGPRHRLLAARTWADLVWPAPIVFTHCHRFRSLNPFLEPLDHLVFDPERAALAEVQALGEIDMTAGLNPYGRQGAGGSGYCGDYRLCWHERIMSAHYNQRRNPE